MGKREVWSERWSEVVVTWRVSSLLTSEIPGAVGPIEPRSCDITMIELWTFTRVDSFMTQLKYDTQKCFWNKLPWLQDIQQRPAGRCNLYRQVSWSKLRKIMVSPHFGCGTYLSPVVLGPQMGHIKQPPRDGWDDNGSTLRNVWNSAPLPSTNPTWSIQGLNPGVQNLTFICYLNFEFADDSCRLDFLHHVAEVGLFWKCL